MEEPKFIYESDKILFAFMYNYIQAEGKEKKDAALKRLSDAILKLMKDQAVVSTLFVNTNGSMINPDKEVNEKDFKLTTLKHSNGKEYIPLFLVSDRLTDIRYPSVVRVTELEKVIRDVVTRKDVEGIFINAFGKPNMVFPKVVLKVILDAYDGKLK